MPHWGLLKTAAAGKHRPAKTDFSELRPPHREITRLYATEGLIHPRNRDERALAQHGEPSTAEVKGGSGKGTAASKS